jgi:hypothetical protein
MDRNLVGTLTSISASLRQVLENAGVENVAEDPEVLRMISRWTGNMQGSSLLEAVSYLFVGVVAVREVLKDVLCEIGLGDGDGLKMLDDLGISASPVTLSPPLGIN